MSRLEKDARKTGSKEAWMIFKDKTAQTETEERRGWL
jgi:hypothetical protein